MRSKTYRVSERLLSKSSSETEKSCESQDKKNAIDSEKSGVRIPTTNNAIAPCQYCFESIIFTPIKDVSSS